MDTAADGLAGDALDGVARVAPAEEGGAELHVAHAVGEGVAGDPGRVRQAQGIGADGGAAGPGDGHREQPRGRAQAGEPLGDVERGAQPVPRDEGLRQLDQRRGDQAGIGRRVPGRAHAGLRGDRPHDPTGRPVVAAGAFGRAAFRPVSGLGGLLDLTHGDLHRFVHSRTRGPGVSPRHPTPATPVFRPPDEAAV